MQAHIVQTGLLLGVDADVIPFVPVHFVLFGGGGQGLTVGGFDLSAEAV